MIWEYDEKAVAEMREKDPKWFLERCILYGLPKGMKIQKKLLKKYLSVLNIPPERRRFFEFLCTGR